MKRRSLDRSQGLLVPIFCGALSASLLATLVHSIVISDTNNLFSSESVAFAFVGSLAIWATSRRVPIVSQLLAILLSVFYTQRILITYWWPDQLDYRSFIGFTRDQLEASAVFYAAASSAILAGTVIAEKLTRKLAIDAIRATRSADTQIQFFGFRVRYSSLATLVMWCLPPLFLTTFYIELSSGFGLVGGIYNADESTLKWFLEIASVLSPWVLFTALFAENDQKLRELARVNLVLVLLSALLAGSKGTLITFALSWYLIARLLGRGISKGHYAALGVTIVISIFVFFPLMMWVRGALLTGSTDLPFSYFGGLGSAMFAFLRRLGGFDWMNLWMSTPLTLIPSTASLVGELTTHINSLVPGEIIPQVENISLAKLQVILGRGQGELFELGGHSENMGGLGTVIVVLGRFGGIFYLALLAGVLVFIERSRLHALHKYVLIYSYLIVFLVGGFYVVIQPSLLWFTILSTFLAMCVWLRNAIGRLTISSALRSNARF